MKFSILIPTYKENFLKECIDSILSQTHSDFEVIIVNDASPYNIDAIIAQYDDNRIRYYKNDIGFGAENVVGNWNKCLSYANGDYVICIGDDDMLLPCCLDLYQKCIITNPDYEVYHIRTAVIDEKGMTINLQEARPEYESIYSLLWHKVNNKRIQFIGDFCFRAISLRERNGFYDLPYACFSDDISVYMAANNKGIRNINELGFQYRTNSQTITNTQDLRGTVTGAERAFTLMNSFLEKKTNNILDETHRLLTLKKMPNYTSEFYLYCIQKNLIQSPISSLKYWNGKGKKYGLNKRKLLKFFWAAIKLRIKTTIHFLVDWN